MWSFNDALAVAVSAALSRYNFNEIAKNTGLLKSFFSSSAPSFTYLCQRFKFVWLLELYHFCTTFLQQTVACICSPYYSTQRTDISKFARIILKLIVAYIKKLTTRRRFAQSRGQQQKKVKAKCIRRLR